ncbi:MAG: hypothetical protein ACRYGL_18165 [Janthinobacterium lividum]
MVAARPAIEREGTRTLHALVREEPAAAGQRARREPTRAGCLDLCAIPRRAASAYREQGGKHALRLHATRGMGVETDHARQFAEDRLATRVDLVRRECRQAGVIALQRCVDGKTHRARAIMESNANEKKEDLFCEISSVEGFPCR